MLLAPFRVLAHAELEESDPADGATITTPYTMTATFSEEFDPDRSFIRVRGPSGDIVAEGGQDPDDPTMMTVDLPELPPGEYTAGWQTVTADDNGVEDGTFTFTVADAGHAEPDAFDANADNPSERERPAKRRPKRDSISGTQSGADAHHRRAGQRQAAATSCWPWPSPRSCCSAWASTSSRGDADAPRRPARPGGADLRSRRDARRHRRDAHSRLDAGLRRGRAAG